VRLLDKLVLDNSGKSDYVKPKEAIEGKISSLYSKIKNPVMTDLKVEIKGVKIKDMYPRQIGDLFEGDQIVLAGRYDCDGLERLGRDERGERAYQTQLVVTGRYEGAERAFEYPVSIRADGKDARYEFVEKIWAIRRVGYILDQIQLSGKNQELIDELVRLSRDYGIMTPYTSFLADERTEMHKGDSLRSLAMGEAKALEQYSGGGGQVGAMNRQGMNQADKAGPAGAPVVAGSSGLDLNASIYDGAVQHGHKDQKNYEGGKQEVVANIRQVGNQAMYRRGSVWIAAEAATIDLDKEKDKIITIDRFSTEYFELVKANTPTQNQVLSSQQDKEELVLKLRGQLYRIR